MVEQLIELIYIYIYTFVIFFYFFFYTLPQVRMKLVKNWLPVLIVCKDVLSQPTAPNHKTVYMELEETLLRIISTLPMSDAQDLLKQCLSFSTRNVDDCPHLVTAFNTWFRRANRPPKLDNTLHQSTSLGLNLTMLFFFYWWEISCILDWFLDSNGVDKIVFIQLSMSLRMFLRSQDSCVYT